MTQLYIPTIGDTLKLTSDWQFGLTQESRNVSLFAHLGMTQHALKSYHWESEPDDTPVWLPAGTLLKVDRLYIRKNQGDFDSITFTVPGVKVATPYEEYDYNQVIGKHQHGYDIYQTVVKHKNRPLRFWVPLKEANTIQFDPQ